MTQQPLSLPETADTVVGRVNQALGLEARVTAAAAKADEALSRSGTYEAEIAEVRDYLYVKNVTATNLVWPSAWAFSRGTVTVDGSKVTGTVTAGAGTGASTAYLHMPKMPATEGETIYFKANKAGSTGSFATIRVRIYFWDAAGKFIHNVMSSPIAGDVVAHQATAPAGAHFFSVWVEGYSGALTLGDVAVIDQIMVAKTNATWFDPDGPLAEWVGTPGASASRRFETDGVVEAVESLEPRVATLEASAGGASSPLFASVTGTTLTVAQHYSATQDLRVALAPMAPNGTPQILSAHLVTNTADAVTTDTTGGTPLLGPLTTDSFGPWRILAQQNIDGDNPSVSHHTGGTHGYNDDNTGTATSRRTALRFAFDGRPVTSGSTPASRVDAWWTNMVQASNTKKADGSGREVLREDYHLTIDATGWHVDYLATALEPITVTLYYGLQIANAAWNGTVLYHDAAPATWLPANVASNSGTAKLVPQISLAKAPHRLEMFMDTAYGLGKRDRLSSGAGALTTTSKTYMRIMSGPALAAGEVVGWRGGYRFWSET